MALVSDTTPNAPVFHLPYGMHYSCVRDGTCCHDWDIEVEDDEAAQILELDWRSCSFLPEAPGATPFIFTRRRQRGERQLRRIGRKCNFLDTAAGVCRLHARYGVACKPRICQRFPFRFVEAPDGIYVGLSFVCHSIRTNTGPSIEEQFDEVREDFLSRPSYHRLPDPIRFEASVPIEWIDYQLIERSLDEILARADRPVGECLIAGHVWLGMMRRMLHSSDRPPSLTPSQLIHFYIERTREDFYARSFEIAQRSAANGALKRMLLGSFVSFRTSLIRRRWRPIVMGQVLTQNIRHWLQLGSLRLPPYEKAFSYKDFHPDPRDLESPEMQALLRRYFRHALFRKDIVRHTEVLWGYSFLVLTYGLVQWYATVLRAMGETDSSEALAAIERYYVHHTNFNQLFLYHPALAMIVQYLFQKPNFAHTIING